MYLKSTTKLVMVLNTKLWVTLPFTAVRYSCIPLAQNSKSYTVFKGSPFEKKTFATFLIAVEMKIIPLVSDLLKGLYLRNFVADRGRHLDRDFRGSCESRLILYKFTFYWLIRSIKLFSPLI